MILPFPANAAPVVLELFTSQGCSSCPPADRLLDKLSREPHIIALSMHVDYWDHLGWKDPFALTTATQRQYDYARAMGRRGVFTPQLVINGQYSVTGSDAAGIRNVLSRLRQGSDQIDMQIKDGLLTLPASKEKTNALIEDIAYHPAAKTHVMRGENAGSDLESVNIVTSITQIGVWEGGAKTLPLEKLPAGTQHVILIRDRNTLTILGARKSE